MRADSACFAAVLLLSAVGSAQKSINTTQYFDNAQDTCNWVCDNENNTSNWVDGSWRVDYTYPTYTITIAYNETANYFASYNRKTHLAAIYAGSLAYIGIYNTTSKAVLLIKTSTAEARLEHNLEISFKSSIPFARSFYLLYEYVLDYSKRQNQTNPFDAVGFLHAVQASANLSGFFKYSLNVYNGITQQFGGFIFALRSSITNVIVGIAHVFSPILNTIGTIPSAFYVAFNAVIKATGGFFNSDFIALIRRAISLPTQVGAEILKQLTNTIKGIGHLYANLQNAVGAFLTGKSYQNTTDKYIEIAGRNVSVQTGITLDNSWLVNIGNKPGSTVNVTVSYNSSINSLGFYNRGLNLAAVFNGDLGLYAIFNGTTGVGVVVSGGTGNAKLANNTRIKDAIYQRNYSWAFSLIAKIVRNFTDLNAVINLNADVFSFRNLVGALRNPAQLDWVFYGKETLRAEVDANFARLLYEGAVYFRANGTNSGEPLNILYPILGVFDLGQSFVRLIGNVYGGVLRGRFNSNLLGSVYNSTVQSIGVGVDGVRGFIFSGLSNAIKLAQNVSGNIGETIQAVLQNAPRGRFDVSVEFEAGTST